jgi:hypothetical protein
MNAIELLKQNWQAGCRLPMPADAGALESLRGINPVAMLDNLAVIQSVGLWEQGELLYLTARRACGVVWLQLQTRGEL